MSRRQQAVTVNLTVSFVLHSYLEKGKIHNHKGCNDETYYWNRWDREIMAVPSTS